MENFTNQEMADMVYVYGEARGSAREALNIYRQRFPNRRWPDARTFTRLYQRLRETGGFIPVRINVGNQRQPDIEQPILDYFNDNPTASVRAAAADLGLNPTRVWRVINENGLHPFRYQRVQGLAQADFAPRVNFCMWLTRRLRRNRMFFSEILFTDEASFYREGIFNHNNWHYWSRDNPRNTRERGHQVRYGVNVWAGIVGDHLIGPYILPDRLTGEVYLRFLQGALNDLLEDVPLLLRRRMWFMQDGAPAHFTREVREHLSQRFPNRWIGRGGPVPWPARSPDLTPMDFYLWGHMKDAVYSTPVESEEALVGRIVAAAGVITDDPTVFANVRRSLENRVQLCMRQNGGHFEHLL